MLPKAINSKAQIKVTSIIVVIINNNISEYT